MIKRLANNIRLLLKPYAAAALIVAAVLSPLALSFVPILLLVWYLYQWRWPLSAFVKFMTQFFVFFALGLVFSYQVGPYWAFLISLPALAGINYALLDTGRLTRPLDTNHSRYPTNLLVVMASITFILLFVSIVVANVSLLIAGGAIIIYLAVMLSIIWRAVPRQPVIVEPVQLRVVAGAEGQVDVTLRWRGKHQGTLFLESYEEWIKLTPNAFISLKKAGLNLKITVKPSLSGTTSVKIKGYVIDPRGLIQTRFELEPVKLVIIPRARYAEWLARKYLSGSKVGLLPLVSSLGSLKHLYGLRRGIEFYGNKLYQPGDSMKNIDWKHSVKYNKLVSKEFTEVQAQPAIMLINLVAGDNEEMDKLAFNIIVTAMSLAQDSIPAAIAAYDEQDVKFTTGSLSSQNLVTGALQMVKEIVIKPDSIKYLNPPDVNRLRANIGRLSQTENQPAKILNELLRFEYQNLSNAAKSHPCTRVLIESTKKNNFTLLVISRRNHDASALAFNEYSLAIKGNTVISV